MAAQIASRQRRRGMGASASGISQSESSEQNSPSVSAGSVKQSNRLSRSPKTP